MTVFDPELLDQVPLAIAVANDPAASRIRINRHFARLLGIDPLSNASLSAATNRPSYIVMQGERVVPPDDLPLQLAARTNAVHRRRPY